MNKIFIKEINSLKLKIVISQKIYKAKNTYNNKYYYAKYIDFYSKSMYNTIEKSNMERIV